MGFQTVFKRYEIKFILTVTQANLLKEYMQEYMKVDKYGKSTICNVYLDTPSYLLIRRSIEKPTYKEKLRIRSYGVLKDNDVAFFELKKKYDGIVYKRRLSLSENEIYQSVADKSGLPNTQIGRELTYALNMYKDLEPKMFLSYEREAFYGKKDKSFRITFDKNILWRDYDLRLDFGVYGSAILDHDKVLMEVKTANSIPLWLCKFLSKHKIYKTSFSKYGNAYKIKMSKQENREVAESA